MSSRSSSGFLFFFSLSFSSCCSFFYFFFIKACMVLKLRHWKLDASTSRNLLNKLKYNHTIEIDSANIEELNMSSIYLNKTVLSCFFNRSKMSMIMWFYLMLNIINFNAEYSNWLWLILLLNKRICETHVHKISRTYLNPFLGNNNKLYNIH